MRIALDTSCVGVRSIGGLAAGGGLAAFLVWHARLSGLILAAAGFLACRSRSLFVAHPQQTVLAQIEKTLGLLALTFRRHGGQIAIPVTRTAVYARALGPATYLSFALGDPRSATEICVVNTLVKYLKYQRYRTRTETREEG